MAVRKRSSRKAPARRGSKSAAKRAAAAKPKSGSRTGAAKAKGKVRATAAGARTAAAEPKGKSSAGASAAGKSGKVVIEGVPPLEVGCSAIAALHSALQVLGAGIPYEVLSVAGGEAFRLYVQLDRMGRADGRHRQPLAGVSIASTSFATYDVLTATCGAVGVRAKVVWLDRKPGVARARSLWKAIERNVRAGRPVPACGVPGSFEHEWCLITGTDEAGKRVFLRDTTHRFDLYGQGPRGSVWQGWMPGPQGTCWMPHVLVEGVGRRRASETRLADAAVTSAVSAAREGFVEPCWAAGLAAYRVWILQLGQEHWHAESARHLREPALANSWLLSNAFAGRRAAGQFFENVARHYAGRKNAAVHKAAKFYAASAGALQTAGALFPNWGQGYEEPERRQRAAELLGIAESAERQAVEALEDAFGL